MVNGLISPVTIMIMSHQILRCVQYFDAAVLRQDVSSQQIYSLSGLRKVQERACEGSEGSGGMEQKSGDEGLGF
jgi:hypothetical protein